MGTEDRPGFRPVRTIAAKAHREALDRARSLPDELLDGLGCPLVMAEPPNWAASHHRVLMLGQETAAWYIPEARTLRDVLALGEPVAALSDAYAAYDFGVRAQRVHFLRALRRLERELEDGHRGAVLWSNVCHVDCAPLGRRSASVAGLPKRVRSAVLEWQRGLLSAELDDLRPHAIIAMCGPKYDDALAAEFDGLAFEPLGDAPVRELARLVHPRLPHASFRTHHPRTLEIAKSPHLRTLIERIRVEAKPLLG